MNGDDGRLWSECMSGDKSAWDTLVKKYSKLVYATIWRTLKEYPNPGFVDVKDVYQDVFIKILEKLHQWERRASLAAWIRVIARRTTIDHLRRQRHIPQESYKDELGDHSGQSADEDESPQDEYSLGGVQNMDPGDKIFANELLTKLNPTELTVIRLNFIEGWSPEEIAEFLNKKVGAIHTIKSRALEKLRKICKGPEPM